MSSDSSVERVGSLARQGGSRVGNADTAESEVRSGGLDKVRSFVRRSSHLHALQATCSFTTCIPYVQRDVDDIVSVSDVRKKRVKSLKSTLVTQE